MCKDIRTDTKANKKNSFYDVFKKRTYKDTQKYNVIVGIVEIQFNQRTVQYKINRTLM